MAKSLWNSKGIGYYFSNLIGRSEGILTLWTEDLLEVILSFKGTFIHLVIFLGRDFFREIY